MRSQLPKGYELDYYQFILSDGDMSKRKEVSEQYTPADGVKWTHLRTYDNFMLDAILAKRAKERK